MIIKVILDAITGYRKPIKINLPNSRIIPERLPKLNEPNLRDVSIALQLEPAKRTHPLPIKLGKFKQALIRNILIFQIERQLIGGVDDLPKVL